MPPIVAGQRFESLQAFKAALRAWAIENNFSPAILDSDSKRVRAGCRSSPKCPFRARCNFNEKQGYATVTTLHNVHTCQNSSTQTDSPGVVRAETSKIKFLLEAVPQLIQVDQDTPTRAIIEAVKAKYGQEIALRQAQKVKAHLCPRRTRASTGTSSLRRTDNPPSHDNERQSAPSSREGFAHIADEDTNMRLSLNDDNRDDFESDHDTRPRDLGYEARRPYNTATLDAPRQPQPRRVNRDVAFMDSILGEVGAGDPHYRQDAHPYGPPSGRTPQEIRSEAAELFERASEKFQEAAFLHAQATRLFASVANS